MRKRSARFTRDASRVARLRMVHPAQCDQATLLSHQDALRAWFITWSLVCCLVRPFPDTQHTMASGFRDGTLCLVLPGFCLIWVQTSEVKSCLTENRPTSVGTSSRNREEDQVVMDTADDNANLPSVSCVDASRSLTVERRGHLYSVLCGNGGVPEQQSSSRDHPPSRCLSLLPENKSLKTALWGNSSRKWCRLW